MATTIDGVPVNPGMVLRLGDGDYLFGAGAVTVVIREVLGVLDHRDECWVELDVEQHWTGYAPVPRRMTVRLGAVRDAAAAARSAR